ncbi:MAG: UDP-3-O-[3-hydroxymyristoyl] N-acetylglucosamine deacetylase [Elusimicrobia bacterium]|nr:UDP-3-O-[3-hydroxymyristoyl] N-acetylglucosamine deacetylase [Elusimicrobiota bacterium]
MKQRTIEKEVSFSGIGLHTGQKSKITFKPAAVDSGICFFKNGSKIVPDADKVTKTIRGTTIGEGEKAIHTVEHLMATFLGMGIDNLCVEIAGDEPPIGDGSAMPFVRMIERAGIVVQRKEKRYYVPGRKIEYRENDVKVEAMPSDKLEITMVIEYDHPVIKKQERTFEINEEVFKREIAPAKTYCFDYEIEHLEKIGLVRGGTLKNAIVIGEKGIHNREIMSFEDEFVRHKILDLMGDIFLIGRPIKAKITSLRGGHSSNIALAKLFKEDIKMTGSETELGLEEIKKAIPHRPPFLFVDRVKIIEPLKKAVGWRKIRPDEWFFKGHFPEYPILPGVLIVESIAQTAGVLFLAKPELENKLPFFMAIDDVKFRNPVFPGDELTLEIEVQRARLRGGKVAGKAFVGEKLVCECSFMFSIVDKK